MTRDDALQPRKTTDIISVPPVFSPPPDMRRRYIEKRKGEIEALLESARNGEWKPVVTIANHVRGSGAMYGFHETGNAAEALIKAIQNGDGDAKSFELLKAYVKTLTESTI